MSARQREAGAEYSRGPAPSRGGTSADSARPGGGVGVRAALAGAALLGAVLLVVADLSTLYSIRIPGGSTRAISGHEQHGFALLILGLLALPMALGSVRGAVPALLALGLVGVVGLGIAVLGDVGDVHATGTYGQLYENATAAPGAAFYEETLGAVLLLTAGGVGLALSGGLSGALRAGSAALSGATGLRSRRERTSRTAGRRREAAPTPDAASGGRPAARGGRQVQDWLDSPEK